MNNSADASSVIRRLHGGSKRAENISIKDKNGKLLLNSSEQEEKRQHTEPLIEEIRRAFSQLRFMEYLSTHGGMK